VALRDSAALSGGESGFLGGGMNEAVSEAAARLERAVGRLADLVARPRPAPGIPPEQVAALAGRLDVSLAKLRGALAELDASEDAEALEAEPRDHPEGTMVDEDGLPADPSPSPVHPEEER
jgi:hypothetical protein